MTDFRHFFDVDRMQIMLSGKMCVVKAGEISKEMRESDLVVVPHGREAPLGLYQEPTAPAQVTRKRKILGLRRPHGISHYLVRFIGPHANSIELMMSKALVFHPFIVSSAMNIVRGLETLSGHRKEFMAVHHRVESDWREHSNHMERLFGPEAEFWVGPDKIKSRVDSVDVLKGTQK